MAITQMVAVLSYDITRAQVRRRVADFLERRMTRVQKSVFEARMDVAAAQRLFGEVEKLVDPGDSLRMYMLSKSGLDHSRVSGGAPLPEEGGFWLL